jgi:hypothetical protein
MFYLVLPGLTLTVGFPELRCLTRTTLDFRPPPDYGSGGQPGVLVGAAHWVPFRSDMAAGVVDGPAAGCPAWPLPQLAHALRRSRVSAAPGRAGSRCPPGRVRCPRIGTAVLRWLRLPGHLTSADEQIRHARSRRGAATAAAGPRLSCRSRTLRPVSGWLRNRTPRSLSTRSVSGRLVSGRLTLPEPVGVHRYRKRSPARRPLDGCHQRRYAWAS